MPDIAQILAQILGFLFVIAFASIIPLIIYLTHLERKQELKERRDQAERLGFEYYERLTAADQAKFAKFALASRGRDQKASNVLVADSGELRMVIFDYCYLTGRVGMGTTLYRQTVVMAQSDLLSFPASEISPEAEGMLARFFRDQGKNLERIGDQFIFHQTRDSLFAPRFLSSSEELNGLMEQAVSLYARMRSEPDGSS